MTINQKTAIRINQDFKEKYNQLWRKPKNEEYNRYLIRKVVYAFCRSYIIIF